MQDVLRDDGLATDAALGEGCVLRDAGVEVVATMSMSRCFVDGVDRVGPRRVGRRRQYVGRAAGLDDVRRVAAAGPLGVMGVDGAALEGGQRVLDEAGFVERVGKDREWAGDMGNAA